MRELADTTHETLGKVREKSNLVSETTTHSRTLVAALETSLKDIYASIKASSSLSQQVADAGAEQLDRIRQIASAIDDLQASSDRTDAIIQANRVEADELAQDAAQTVQHLSRFDIPDRSIDTAA